MKKIIIFLISFLTFTNVYANSLSKLEMDIFIKEDGSASIKEIWTANFNKDTEGFKQYYNLGNLSISNFKVSMNNQSFESLSSWDIDASFNEKAYKSGINIVNEGIELCFGISEYGTNKYTLTYDIKNFVQHVADADMVFFPIVPEEFKLDIDYVYVKIHSDFAYDKDFGIWGYGYDGTAYVYDGYMEMSTDTILKNDQYMIALIKFPLNTFNTGSSLNQDFDYYLNGAEEGAVSTAPKNNTRNFLLENFLEIFYFIVVLIGSIAGFIKYGSRASKVGTKKLDFSIASRKLDKDVPFFRDIPCNKDIFKAYWVATAFNLVKKQTDFMGSLLLKWLNENKISIKSVTTKILKKEEKAIEFKNDVVFNNNHEQALYNMMKEASLDGILEKNEFQKYCNKNYKVLMTWFDELLDSESDKLIDQKLLVQGNKKVFGITTYPYFVENALREDAIKLKGLKNFLLEFTNIKDKSAIEVKLLNEYLMFAQIFGIADKVVKEFKRLYPEFLDNMDYSYDDILFIHMVSYSGGTAASFAQERAEDYSSGGGGFSSFGGGGGSFGGGGGGGTR